MPNLFKNSRWALSIMACIIFLTILGARIRGTGSDPQGTLLVSEALVQHHTVKLDAYRDILPRYSYKVHLKNLHYYYFFPLGTSVFSVPIVYMANLCGFGMVNHEGPCQMAIASLIAIGSFLLLFLTSRHFLTPLPSVFASATFWFGTSFASTGGTGLWSHDLAALFALAAIYLALKRNRPGHPANPFFIGFCLFGAYFCRPTLSLLSPVLLCYLWFAGKRLPLKTAATLILFMGLFMGWSWHEFHQLLPDYYMPKRLDGRYFWTALYGNLFSPARGLFVYSPFLLLSLLSLATIWKKQSQFRPLFILLAWPLIHLIVISRFDHWWAGHSFGPRLMYDVLPGLFVFFLLYLYQLGHSNHRAHKALLTVAILFAVSVNTVQGLYNPACATWNAEPSIDQFPQYLFDWKYPQFLNTPARQAQRMELHMARQRAVTPP